MGCGGSKQGMAATHTSISYRRPVRMRYGAANSNTRASAAFADVVSTVAATPAAAAATATTTAVVSGDVKDKMLYVDGRMAAGEEEEARKPTPPDVTSTGDSAADPSMAQDDDKVAGYAGEGRVHGGVHGPGGDKVICSAPPKLCDVCDTPKPDVCGHGPRDQEDNFSPTRDAQVETLRRQLQQVAEQLACFEIWCPEDDDKGYREEEDVVGSETHEEEGLNLQAEEEDPRFIKETVFEEEDQFGDAPEVFKEDFSNKIPVYDEDPYDPTQVPSVGSDPSTEGNAIASHLPFGKGGTSDDQIEQMMYFLENCGYQKFVKVRQSKLYGSEGKRKSHYQLHHSNIRKHRRRRTYKLTGAVKER